jgi:hypothetical protein
LPKAFLCPYFRRHKKATKHSPERVVCAGGIVRLNDDQMRRDWICKYCALDYRECQIYQTQTAYYNRNGKTRD